ncbi:MAG: hypothetical protein R3Y61_05755 [Rikenellaceae bacterium]
MQLKLLRTTQNYSELLRTTQNYSELLRTTQKGIAQKKGQAIIIVE